MGLTVPLKLAVLRRLVNSMAEADLMVSVVVLVTLLVVAGADDAAYRCC